MNLKQLKIVMQHVGLYSVVGLAGCSSMQHVMNQPVVDKPINRYKTVKAQKKQNELMLILTFSGGGTRAAAMSYGVLKGLKDIPITNKGAKKSLLSEVDIISSVSGGSFTAAYYGLFGNQIFSQYEKDFLKRPVQSALLNAWLFSPRNWYKLSSYQFNRTDLAAEYYDKHIFKQKTFTDMRDDAPQIIINATDVGTGNSFAFTPEDMRRLCSDISSYPVSRAVAASAAVPAAFSPITLKNHAGCQLYDYQKNAAKVATYNDRLVLNMRQYLNKKQYPYVHLVDGGITDNLGVRSVLRSSIQTGDHFPTILKTYGLEKTKKVAFIIVNSADAISPKVAKAQHDPGIENVVSAATTIQLQRYNAATLDLLNTKFKKWAKQIRTQNCGRAATAKSDCIDVKFYAIELNLQQLPKKLAKEMSLYPTSLELPAEKVDKLVAAGTYLLNHSPEFKRFLHDIKKDNLK